MAWCVPFFSVFPKKVLSHAQDVFPDALFLLPHLQKKNTEETKNVKKVQNHFPEEEREREIEKKKD